MLGPKPDAPERETWEAVIERKSPDCDTIRPMRTAYGVRTGDEILWVRTVTDLTAPEVCEKYRRRCLLMSAAPDLLKAAKTALVRVEDCCECPRSCRGCMALDEARETLQAAIAKAQGRDAGERDAD